jgi:hypothetical protein
LCSTAGPFTFDTSIAESLPLCTIVLIPPLIELGDTDPVPLLRSPICAAILRYREIQGQT